MQLAYIQHTMLLEGNSNRYFNFTRITQEEEEEEENEREERKRKELEGKLLAHRNLRMTFYRILFLHNVVQLRWVVMEGGS